MWLVWFRSSSCTYQTSQSTRCQNPGPRHPDLPRLKWNVFGVPPDGETEDDEEPFMICEDLCEIIADTEQAEGVEVIKKSDEYEEPRANPGE